MEREENIISRERAICIIISFVDNILKHYTNNRILLKRIPRDHFFNEYVYFIRDV